MVVGMWGILGAQAGWGQTDPWPSVGNEAKPWARWWWMGNAINEQTITQLMGEYADVGFGGLEIAPIYGAKGYEQQYLPYLSPDWMAMLRHAVKRGDSLGLGIDLTVGTGWPFGGPQVRLEDAATRVVYRTFEVQAGMPFTKKIVPEDPKQLSAPLLSLTAYDERGHAKVITNRVAADGTLKWQPTNGRWTLYAVFEGKTFQRVKRAAPGGEGYTLNHFSRDALNRYLSRFDSAFHRKPQGIRAFYNDSYEVYGADWSADFFTEFKKRRGYDLRLQVRELFSGDTTANTSRVKSDYRETMAELLLEQFTVPWTQWAHRYGSATKNQAHGSPGNLLDLYAAVDIPEAETFGSSFFPIPGLRRDSADVRNVDPDPVMMKFASSAANVTGKRLASSETFTWLTEHFKTSLAQCKPEVEQCFLAGINHVFYHGVTYSPEEAGWPGWLFYASVNFVPNNSWWPHLDGLNGYITRVQSVLQSGKSDNELLMYWPVYDNWDDADGRMMTFTVHHIDRWLQPTPFYENLQLLHRHGYAVDFISDNLLAAATVSNGRIRTSPDGTPYKALVVPVTRRMPEETLRKLINLARQGATIVLQAVPEDIPGLGNYTKRHTTFKKTVAALPGSGAVISPDVVSALQTQDIHGEPLAAHGLGFIRRNAADGTYYYVVNHQSNAVDAYIPLLAAGNGMALMLDPQSGAFGKTPCVAMNGHYGVRIQLRPGEAVIVKVGAETGGAVPDWDYLGQKLDEIPLANPWQLEFENGGPELPKSLRMDTLQLWTRNPDEVYQTFSGMASYSTTVTVDKTADPALYVLELEKVHESARVYINEQEAGLVWSLPYRLRIGHLLKPGENSVRIEVANLMANRIRDMDRKGMEWRRYHEINFVNIDYKPFDAADWLIQPSGLAGPARIIRYKSE
ncbi:alpha-L-rhamnosidase [Parapedobacter composti]|uniref:Alpha-L-rhamnosidase n=2 Tax=Parapedobacter composti TaxID=623281 RepID=A0A1I1E3D7_9SPHI|nr:alpha-L-rhamnosidase [Parapedobacter composti]